MTIVLLAAHVSMSAPLALSLKVTSIQLIPISAPNAVLALMRAPAVPSTCNLQTQENRKEKEERQAAFLLLLFLLLSLAYTNCANASRMRRMASMMFSSLVA